MFLCEFFQVFNYSIFIEHIQSTASVLLPYQNQLPQSIENCYLFYKYGELRLEDSNLLNFLKAMVNLFFSTVQCKQNVTFTQEILNGKLHFLCSGVWRSLTVDSISSKTLENHEFSNVELAKLQRLVILISFPSDKIVRLAVVKWIIIIQTGFNRLVYYLAIRKPLLNDKVGWGKQQRSILINNFDRETF